jgi:cysteinyl-tRNA synthetase
MSKSLGNVYTIDDVLERGFSSRALRFALLRGHYRQPLNFTWDAMKDAAAALETLGDLVARLRRAADEPEEGGASGGLERVAAARAAFEQALDDDLNVGRALPALFGLRTDALEGRLAGAGARAGLELVEDANRVLGVLELEPQDLDAEVESLIAARQAARQAKDWPEADRLRDELDARGIVLEDTPAGATWRRREGS